MHVTLICFAVLKQNILTKVFYVVVSECRFECIVYATHYYRAKIFSRLLWGIVANESLKKPSVH